MPSSQTGWRASRTTSRASKPAASLSLAPLRWHSEAVAVHTLAATASRMALSISLPLRLAGPRPVAAVTECPRPDGLRCVVSCYDDSGTAASSACTAISALARQAHGGVPCNLKGLPLVLRPGQVERDTRAAEDGQDHEGDPDDHHVHAEVAG